MICQEVMDEMQRQLDDDLEPWEVERLQEHMRRCTDCALMFERLQRLSTELENLPKVEPSYSLVDAILPRLEQLDSHAAEPPGSSSVAAEPPPVYSRKLSTTNWLQRPVFRALSGVLAASVVAALFIVTYTPSELKDGDEAMYNAANGSAVLKFSASSNFDDAAPAQEAADDVDEGTAFRVQMEPETIPPSAMDVTSGGAWPEELADNTLPQDVRVEDQHGSGTQLVPPSGMEDKSKVTPSSQPPSNSADVTNAPPDARYESAGGNTAAESPPGGAEPSAGRNAPDGTVGTGNSTASSDNNGNNNSNGADTGGSTGTRVQEEPEMSISGSPDLLEGLASSALYSPDGTYYARIEEPFVRVYNVTDQKLVYESKALTGSIGNLQWQSGESRLTYQVTDEAGNTTNYEAIVRQ